MITETELVQYLTLISSQPTWTMKEHSKQHKFTVQMLNLLPKATGIYWVAGQTTLKCGYKLPSVFRVNTDSGGTLIKVYWKIQDRWFRHDDADVLISLGLLREDVFPFDWSFAIPLEEDIFHPSA